MIEYSVKVVIEGLGEREFKNVISDGEYPDNRNFYYVHCKDNSQRLYHFNRILELEYSPDRQLALESWRKMHNQRSNNAKG